MTDEAEKRALEAAAAADMEKRNFNSGVRLEAACRAYARSLNGVWISREDARNSRIALDALLKMAHALGLDPDEVKAAEGTEARIRQQLGE